MYVRTYTTWKQAADAASLALTHRLYVNGWLLAGDLRAIVNHDLHAYIALAFDDDQPVAIAMVNLEDLTMMAYCNKNYRRMGYTSRCVKAIISLLPRSCDTPIAGGGIKGSNEFWKKNDVDQGSCDAYTEPC